MYELYDPCTVMFFYRSASPLFTATVHLSVLHSNKHIMIDLGTGNNNKMCVFLRSLLSSVDQGFRNWAMDNKQEVSIHPFSEVTLVYPPQLIDIIETVYRGASKGRGLVVSPKGLSSVPLPLRVSDAPR